MKFIKVFFYSCLVLIALSGCAESTDLQEDTRFQNLVSNHTAFGNVKDTSLGSQAYVDNILKIANKSGYRSALEMAMLDFVKYGSEFDHGVPENNLRVYRLFSYLIYKSGSIDREAHYFRNLLNRAPESLQALLDANDSLPPSKRWVLLSVNSSLYHMQGKDGIYNLKFVSANGFCEAVYNKQGELLTEKNDPVNMGTFNYGAGIPQRNSHYKFDVEPYLKWGNSASSPQKGEGDISAGIKQAFKLYKEHKTDVDQYRNQIRAKSLIKS